MPEQGEQSAMCADAGVRDQLRAVVAPLVNAWLDAYFAAGGTPETLAASLSQMAGEISVGGAE